MKIVATGSTLLQMLLSCSMKCQTIQSFQNQIGITTFPTSTITTLTTSLTTTTATTTAQKISFTRRGSAKSTHPSITLYGEKYGKGAEIYPTTNEIQITLADSFPKNVIPSSVESLIKQKNYKMEQTMNTILQSAAKSEQQSPTMENGDGIITGNATSSETSPSFSTLTTTSTSSIIDPNPISKPPIIISILLLLTGLIPPIQIITVTFFSGYLLSLVFIAASPKSETNMNPIVKSLPPTSHVPTLVSDPFIGSSISKTFMSYWNGFAIIAGYILPIIYLIHSLVANGVSKEVVTTITTGGGTIQKIIATNIFLISCQIISENMSRKVLTPLPIKILIPIMYNTVRMGSLYQWITCWSNMDMVGQGLALINFAYWGFNLFGFLIPIAAMRYMRSYFFGVEAEEVLVREGDEDNIGLLGK